MKIYRPLYGFSLVFLISLIACHKAGENRIRGNGKSTSEDPFVVPDREYFWRVEWHPALRGDEIHLNAPRLVDSQIGKGIEIGVAVYSDWDRFEKIPFKYYDSNKNDTIHLWYEMMPGQLQIIAKAPFTVTYPSDVYIQYK